jgi:DNA-binding PadR family transcriptional regulator
MRRRYNLLPPQEFSMTYAAQAQGRFDPRWLGWLAMAGRHHHGRHRHGGRGFPFAGGPWGFGPGGPMGRGGARARRGDVRAAMLKLLAEEPRNGYQLMQEIEQRSGGVWRPSPGSVYPALQQLEDEGLVRAEETDGRKLFHLTDAGREAAAAIGAEGAPWDAVSESVDSDVWELFAVAKQVGMAIFQIAQAGSSEQIASAREVLNNARRSLYGILAEDDPEPGAEPDTEPPTEA